MHVAQYCSCSQVPTRLSEWIPINKAESLQIVREGGRSRGKRVNESSTRENDSPIQKTNSEIQDDEKSYTCVMCKEKEEIKGKVFNKFLRLFQNLEIRWCFDWGDILKGEKMNSIKYLKC